MLVSAELPPCALIAAAIFPPVVSAMRSIAESRMLAAFVASPPCQLELLEGLEQLRFLHNATPVRCVQVDARGRVFWELNNPQDVARIEAALEAQ